MHVQPTPLGRGFEAQRNNETMMDATTDRHKLINRLKTVAGHVRGIQRMVETNAYCIDIIKQTQAVQRALARVNSLLLEDYLNQTVTSTLRDGTLDERERVVQGLLHLYHAHRPPANPDDLPATCPDERIARRLAWLAQVETAVQRLAERLAAPTCPVATIESTQEVQQMLDVFQDRVLADHLNGCVRIAIRSQQPGERERVVRELLQVFEAAGSLP